jgi:hypothetical protein
MIILKLSNEYFLYLYSYLAISFPDYQLKYFQELIVPKKYLTNSKCRTVVNIIFTWFNF